MRLRRLGPRFLDLEFLGVDGVRIRVVERPGLWMSPAQVEALLADLRRVVAESVPGGTLDYGIFSGDPAQLERGVVTVIHDATDGRPIAFNALALLPVTLGGREEEVLHFGLAVVAPSARGRGLSWALYGLTVMLMFMHRQLRTTWISNVTQVPSVFGLVAESLVNVYPDANGGARCTFAHRAIATEIMARHRAVFGAGPAARFDARRFVIMDGYAPGARNLMKDAADAPRHRIERYNAFCRAELDYVRGDDFLQLGQYSMAVARHYLLRDVPRGSLPALLATAAVVLAGAVIAPALQWFAAGSPMQDLRPWREPSP